MRDLFSECSRVGVDSEPSGRVVLRVDGRFSAGLGGGFVGVLPARAGGGGAGERAAGDRSEGEGPHGLAR